MLREALESSRDLRRLREIGRVLVRHGLGDLAQRSGVVHGLRRAGEVLHLTSPSTERPASRPERLRSALEELGPTFVKLGQVLSGRTDLLPPDWTDELARLQQQVAPSDFEQVYAQLTEDLGQRPEQAFDGFEREPLACASIAQVHRARLADGTEVVLKVRRPGIRAVVQADLRLLAHLAQLVEESSPELRRWRPRQLVRQFARSLNGELDLAAEARVARRMALDLEHSPDFVVPRVHRASERLMVMDYLAGPSVAEWLESRRPPDLDTPRLARIGAEAVLRMVFVNGLYHADPHPGNLILLGLEDDDGQPPRLGLIDFGMVGRLSDARRSELLRLLTAVAGRREEEAVDVLLTWADGNEVDEPSLAADCLAWIDRYHGASLAELDAVALLTDVTSLVRENQLALPADVALLIKLFVTLESLGRALDPDFRTSDVVAPFAERALREQGLSLASARRELGELAGLLMSLPRDLRGLLRRLRRGRLGIDLDLKRLDEFGHQLDRSANRVTVGLVTAALIVGTAIALTVPAGEGGGPTAFGLPLFALLGFASSLAVGIWLVGSILRSGRS